MDYLIDMIGKLNSTDDELIKSITNILGSLDAISESLELLNGRVERLEKASNKPILNNRPNPLT